jgi:PAS domain-containing protein
MASPFEESIEQFESRSQQVNDLFDSSELAQAIEDGEFRHFLDNVPIALAISKFLRGDQRIIYVNKAFENLFGQASENLRGAAGRSSTAFSTRMSLSSRSTTPY